MHSDLIDLKD